MIDLGGGLNLPCLRSHIDHVPQYFVGGGLSNRVFDKLVVGIG